MQYKPNPKRMTVGGSMIEGVQQFQTATSGEGECAAGDNGCLGRKGRRKQKRRNKRRIRRARY